MTLLPKGWQEVTLRSVCEPTYFWNPQRQPRDEFWYVDVSAVSRDSYAIRTPQRVKAVEAPSRARKIIQTGDTIFATVRPALRRVAFVDKQFSDQIASTAFCVVRADRQQALPRFLYYILLTDSLNEEIIKFQSGASYPAVNDKDVLHRTIPLPPKQEQAKIAAVLWKIQWAIEVEETLISVATELKQSAMRHLFTRGLRGEPQSDTDIGLLPKSWRLIPASHIFRLTSGRTRPADIVPRPTKEKPYPVLGGNGVMGYSSEWFLDSKECLVIGRVGEYCGAVHLARGKVWITDNALYAREWLDDSVRVDYLTEFLRYYDLNRFKRMAGQPLVTQGLINEHSFPIPAPEEQRDIAATLQAIDRKVSVQERKRMTLQQLFKTLLNQLMTGQVRVDELDIDVAEVAAA